MILAELVHFHHNGPFESGEPRGFEWKKIPYVLVLDTAGKLCAIEDMRDAGGIVRKLLVPAGAKRTKGISANLLWDTAEYVLGMVRDGKADRAAARHAAFKANLRKIAQQDEGVRSVCRFLEEVPWRELEGYRQWPEILATNPLLSFRLDSDQNLVCARPAVVSSISRMRSPSKLSNRERGICLVTGKQGPFEKVHPWILGVHGTEHGRGRLISSGQRAFESYGCEEERFVRAPVSKSATLSYAAALNHLLAPQSRQRIQLGGLTVVFWTEDNCGFERIFARFAGSPWEEESRNPDEWLGSLQGYGKGRHKNSRFFALGLAGHGSRISVAFWISEPIGRIAGAIANHCCYQSVTSTERSELFVPLSEGLDALRGRFVEPHVPDGLGAAVLRALILDEPYPRAAYSRLLLNLGSRGGVDYVSAALIKAHLNRAVAVGASRRAGLPASFDPHTPDPGYLWGSFFALCDFIDLKTSPRWSRSLAAQLYKAVSARPASWFEGLHRSAKAKLSRNISRKGLSELETRFDSVTGMIRSKSMPENLDEEDQGRFAVGYFQQREELRNSG